MGAGESMEFGGMIDEGALRAMDGMDAIRMAWEKHSPDFLDRNWGPVTGKQQERQRELAGIRWAASGTFAPFPNTAAYPPTLYLPAMLGWRLGEGAGWTIFWSLRLARLLCALTAVGLGWLALRVSRGWRWGLLPFLLLPTVLFLEASCSQDAALLGVAALLAAVVARPLAERREWTAAELAGVGAMVAACATARAPYLAMAPVLFLPSVELAGWPERATGRAPGTGMRWLWPALAFAGVAGIWAAWRHVVAPLGFDAADWADPELQVRFLRAHPFASAAAVLRGTMEAGLDCVRRGAYVAGWNDLVAPRWLVAGVGVCAAAMVILGPASPVRSWRGRTLLGVCVAGPLLGVSLAEYVIWTQPGLHTVWGVMPRYWLPLMPLATMLVQSLRRRLTARRLLACAALGLAGLACTLPWMAAHAFYQQSVWPALRLNLR
jgi:hypothetical protein